MDYQRTGLEVFRAMGGNDNVNSATHCATRLRFRLKDMGAVDMKEVGKIPGVLKCLQANGEMQVVIGPNVTTAYQAIEKEFQGKASGTADAGGTEEKKKPSERFLGMISGIFTPVIPAITAAGMVKAVLALLNAFGVINNESQAYMILSFASDAAFYFMPVMLANSAAKIFGMSSGLAMMLAGMLLHPNFVAMVDEGAAISLFGIPVRAVKYSSTVIPVILIVFVASYVEKYANKILPDVIKYIVRPLCVMAVMIPLSLCVLGPVGYIAGDGLAAVLSWINGITPWLLPTVMGTFTPVLVMFGLHNGLIPLASTQLATLNYENIMGPGMLPSNMAQGAASLAVSIRSKNGQTKQTALSTGFTALMGITEPAMYGITLKYKKLLPAVMAGGLFAGLSGLVRYSFGSPGLATLPVFIGDSSSNLIKALITAAIGFAVTFIITMFVKLEDEENGQEEDKNPTAALQPDSAENEETVIASPLTGRAVDLSNVKDETFAERILGDGMAVVPEEGIVSAPADGTVMLYDTLHALGITCPNGTEILIHVGMDTVQLKGKYFQAEVENGAFVKQGDILLRFDIEQIKKAGYEVVTPVIITSLEDAYQIEDSKEVSVKRGDPLYRVVKK